MRMISLTESRGKLPVVASSEVFSLAIRASAAAATTWDLLSAEDVIDKELSKMTEAVCLPTASRSMLGVLNEYVHLAGHVHEREGGPPDLARLEDWLAQTPMGPLHKRHGSPDRELSALTAGSN